MSEIKPNIDPSWLQVLNTEFQSPYFAKLKQFIVEEKAKYTIYPPGKYIFNAFNLTPFDKVKVVILGQDPYHGPGQAHGLCFSVPDGITHPPSLINIFKEITNDLGTPVPLSGNLERWARQGVLLLNATLTVRAHNAGSHQKKGWEQFTDTAIKALSSQRDSLVFMLWGRFAQDKDVLIDNSRHLVLKTVHPSPFSAGKGFFGCKHFSKANAYLEQQGVGNIEW
jgi:uracil-DNA glycosylase